MVWLAGIGILILAGICWLCLELYSTLLRLVEATENAAVQAREDRQKIVEAIAGSASGNIGN